MKIGRHISLRFEQWRFEEIQEILGDLKIRFKLLKTKSGEDSLVKVFYKEEEIYKDNKKDLQDSHSNSHSKRASKKKEESKSRGRG